LFGLDGGENGKEEMDEARIKFKIKIELGTEDIMYQENPRNKINKVDILSPTKIPVLRITIR